MFAVVSWNTGLWLGLYHQAGWLSDWTEGSTDKRVLALVGVPDSLLIIIYMAL
jgi:hypothetical protein